MTLPKKSATISICQPIIDFALHIKSVLKFQTIPKTLGIHSVNDVIVLRNDDVIDYYDVIIYDVIDNKRIPSFQMLKLCFRNNVSLVMTRF